MSELAICTFPSPNHFQELGPIENYRRQIIFGTRQRRGEIYLGDSDALYIVKKPFYLQPAPPRLSSKSHNSRPSQNQDQYRDEDSDTEVEREEFSYDSDACEKV